MEELNGRWCPECGGETRFARACRDGVIYTYLRCVFCGWRRSTLTYRLAERRHWVPVEAGLPAEEE